MLSTAALVMGAQALGGQERHHVLIRMGLHIQPGAGKCAWFPVNVTAGFLQNRGVTAGRLVRATGKGVQWLSQACFQAGRGRCGWFRESRWWVAREWALCGTRGKKL